MLVLRFWETIENLVPDHIYVAVQLVYLQVTSRQTWQCLVTYCSVYKLSLCKVVIAHFRPVFLYVIGWLRAPFSTASASCLSYDTKIIVGRRCHGTALVCSRVADVTTLFTTAKSSRSPHSVPTPLRLQTYNYRKHNNVALHADSVNVAAQYAWFARPLTVSR